MELPGIVTNITAFGAFVDVGDHPVELGTRRSDAHLLVRFAVFLRDQKRTVRRVGGDVAEEGPVLILFNEPHRPVEKDVGAVSGLLGRRTVVPVGVVEIIVSPLIGRLRDSAAAVHENFVKPLILRPTGEIVAEMPFAEAAGAVSALGEYFCNRDFIGMHDRTAHDRVPDTGAAGIPAGHQRGTCWRTCRIDVKIRQPHGVRVQTVHRGRFDLFVAEAGDVAVPLIVGKYYYDVWAPCQIGPVHYNNRRYRKEDEEEQDSRCS